MKHGEGGEGFFRGDVRYARNTTPAADESVQSVRVIPNRFEYDLET